MKIKGEKMDGKTYVKMTGITKTFGSVTANKNVNFKVKQGEIYALLGENGAGKSTLMNMLSGIYMPDSGSIFIHDKLVHFKNPKDAIKAGIGMIHQHFKLVDIFTGRENILLGKGSKGFFVTKKDRERLDGLIQKYNFNIDIDKKVYNMSVGEKQTVEILKVLYRGADILILDEPTAVLTPQEIRSFFEVLKKMRENGCAIIIITHKLNEVMEISDWVTVLRKGETVGTVKTSTTNPKELTDLMVGEEVNLEIKRAESEKGDTLLEVSMLKVVDGEGVTKLDNVSFKMKSGEILGVAGVAGSGQKELCEAIAGIELAESGDILYEGKSIIGKSCREILEKGITMSFIPEDRLGMGLVASMDMVDNIILKDYYRQKGFMLDRKDGAAKAKEIIKKLDIKTPGINHPVRLLSGGNIQKVMLGREIEYNPHIIVTAYATRGLDIGASHVIYDLLNEQKEKGVGILFIGEDLDVLMELTDRIMVMCDGKVTGIVDSKKITKEQLGFLMGGKSAEEIGVVSKYD